MVKYGGAAMVDEQLKQSFAQDVVLLKYVGINVVVVHGGGPQINETLGKMGIQSRYVRGMRVTDSETIDIIEMVLVGKVNKEIVALINQHGCAAVGLSGKDGQLILARKMNMTVPGDGESTEIIDIGMVGEIVRVDPTVIRSLDGNRFIPVIAPVGVGERGETYNINADLVAGGGGRRSRGGKAHPPHRRGGGPGPRGRVDQHSHRLPVSGPHRAGRDLFRDDPQGRVLRGRPERWSGQDPYHRRPGPARRPAGDFHQPG